LSITIFAPAYITTVIDWILDVRESRWKRYNHLFIVQVTRSV